jgi:SelR domain
MLPPILSSKMALVTMPKITILLALLLMCFAILSCNRAKPNEAESARIRLRLAAIPLDQKVQFTNDEWKYILTGRQYYVLRRRGTELPFANAYWHTHEKGIYFCAACGNPLFSSDAKYDSGTGCRVFGNRLEETRSVRQAIQVSAAALRSPAPGAARILGTCSTTDLSRPGCVTA